MGKTVRGGKDPSYEYWGRRCKTMREPGRFTKKYTHKKERRDIRKELRHE